MEHVLIRNAKFSFDYSAAQGGLRSGGVRRLVEGEIVFESDDFKS